MENASKALLIAGAILVTILIISLGIMILGKGQDIVSNSGMSKAELSAFNNTFLKYERARVSGAEAKQLMNDVLANNADQSNIDNGRLVTVKLGSETLTGTSKILTSATYKVEITTYTEGRVSVITLTKL